MTVLRVRYTERQLLTAPDLNDERDYLVSGQRRHLVRQHRWGIVHGLRLELVSTGFVIQPGYAVDGQGEELIVGRSVFRPWATDDDSDIFDSLGAGTFSVDDGDGTVRIVDVWLVAVPEGDSTDTEDRACPPERGHQPGEARLCLGGVRDGGESGQSRIPDPCDRVPAGNEQVGLPVFLGRLARYGGEDTSYAIDDACRSYAGLVGVTIASASTVAVREDPQNPPSRKPDPLRTTELELTERVDGERRVDLRISDAQGVLTRRMSLDTLSGAAIRAKTVFGDPLGLPDLDDPRDSAVDLRVDRVDPTFTADDVRDPDRLACLLGMASATHSFDARGTDRRQVVAQALNTLLADATFEPERYSGLPLRGQTRRLIDQDPDEAQRVQARRAVLEDLFADQLNASTELPAAHGVEFRPPMIKAGARPPTPVPAPWRVYRTEFKRDGRTVRQLRFEIGTSGDKRHPERSQLAIGSTSGDGQQYAFKPCLTVDEACRVKVHGSLTVTGQLIEKPAPTDPAVQVDLEAAQEAWQRGIANEMQDQDLAVEFTVRPAATADWPYEVRVTNTGPSTVRDIDVLEVFAIEGVTQPARSVGRIATLAAHTSQVVPVSHSSGTSGAVSLVVTLVGLGGSNAMYASVSASVHVP